ncbi:peptidase U32 family protein [Lutispora thermophila]|uniref:Putative protease n=1 Tax=Lutispora thermophila DSM 19022 TaxID=1122184 RepID=A0A1M6F2S8_9FIRM|nr:U32 family peptidase [Lutispora thermophila]SHI91980.1 putative protease [Lutispora thermophila DSM 19022]
MTKPELLAPAGNFEKLKMALIYGADAVYLGGERFGLRAQAGNFTMEEIKEAVRLAHELGRKIYVTVNIIPHNEDLEGLSDYVKELDNIGVDALIFSDPGIFLIIKEAAPNMELHLSTQANNTNYKSAEFWYKQGVKRIVLARELSLIEIKEIIKKSPKELEFEAFIHGAMCISYSGRCLLSNYMVGRDANRGECAHPCRYKYYLVEEKRPGQYMPVEEDEKGTYIFNSRDLCMIEHIPELVNSGIKSFKIEGRMKSSYYIATVVGAYRKAIDQYFNDPNNYVTDKELIDEVYKASHREFSTGFYFGKPDNKGQIYENSSYVRDYAFVGLVMDYDASTGIATIEQRNKMSLGEEIEIIGPHKKMFKQVIDKMWDEEGQEIESAPHPQQIVKMRMRKEVSKYDILRREGKENE